MTGDKQRLDDYLAHILEAIERIEHYVADLDEMAFLNNLLVQDAASVTSRSLAKPVTTSKSATTNSCVYILNCHLRRLTKCATQWPTAISKLTLSLSGKRFAMTSLRFTN